MVCANKLSKEPTLPQKVIESFVQLLAPLAPHICEELWERLGNKASIVESGWPQFDATKLVEESVKIIFQVNGKYRGDARVPADITKEEVLSIAKKNERVQCFIDGKLIKKEIYVPGKIVNIVAV
jgi:leucyl-tRNA synthetase